MLHAAVDFGKWFVKWLTHTSRLEEKIDVILANQTNLERRILRLEILSAIRRNDRTTVHVLYDEYKIKYNGNSYMDEVVGNYFKKGKRNVKDNNG